MYGSMVDIQSATAENRRGKKEEEEETAAAKCNRLPYWAAIISAILFGARVSRPLVVWHRVISGLGDGCCCCCCCGADHDVDFHY